MILSHQVNIRLNSQFLNGISRVLQKLFRYINGTAISTFAVPALTLLFSSFDLNLNDSQSDMLSFGSSL